MIRRYDHLFLKIPTRYLSYPLVTAEGNRNDRGYDLGWLAICTCCPIMEFFAYSAHRL